MSRKHLTTPCCVKTCVSELAYRCSASTTTWLSHPTSCKIPSWPLILCSHLVTHLGFPAGHLLSWVRLSSFSCSYGGTHTRYDQESGKEHFGMEQASGTTPLDGSAPSHKPDRSLCSDSPLPYAPVHGQGLAGRSEKGRNVHVLWEEGHVNGWSHRPKCSSPGIS